MAQRATGKDKGRRNNKGGKLCFPAAVTEVLQPSLSCVHGLRLQVFLRRHIDEKRACQPLPGVEMASKSV